MSRSSAAARVAALPETRAVWRTQKVRAEDLVEGDVARNRYGKWDIVREMHHDDDEQEFYVRATFARGGDSTFVKVDLVDVQVVKPS